MSYVESVTLLKDVMTAIEKDGKDSIIDRHTIIKRHSANRILQFTYVLISAGYLTANVKYGKDGSPTFTSLNITESGVSFLNDCHDTNVWSLALENLTNIECKKIVENWHRPILTLGDLLDSLRSAKRSVYEKIPQITTVF